jgi:acyl carrier protein
MNEIETWLVEYFKQHGECVDGHDEILGTNYFDREYLDSLGVVQMITSLEDHFGVRIESEHMQDPRFCTIRGLAQIVGEIRS